MTLLNRWFDFLDLLRMDRWFNKLEMTFFCGAVVLFLQPMDEPFKPFAYFTVWNLFFYSYLYLINSVCEREEDLKGGRIFTTDFHILRDVDDSAAWRWHLSALVLSSRDGYRGRGYSRIYRSNGLFA